MLAQKTEIWIVRHAEKDKTNPQDTDPDLSIEGKKRAEDLVAYLSKVKFDVVLSTPFKRTRQTLKPLIKQNKIEITDYQKVNALVSELSNKYLGKTIIIAGHSNTILEIIEALGIKRPIDLVNDNDYNYIFQVTLEGNHKKVQMNTYGNSN